MKQLIIPFCVEALLSNGKTSDDQRVPVIAPDYRKVSYTSLLGSKNTPGNFQTGSVLKAGAHLHFILPDAFTHAGAEGYPAVPDRYVVTRLYADDSRDKIITKCFVVESNFMSTDFKYADSITIPRFQETDLRRNWRYLGRSYQVENAAEQEGNEEYLEKLTAVGAGDPMFAAYYPSCSSVFGFYDDLQDVPLNTSISYFVMGYYCDRSNDRFGSVKTTEDFQRLLMEMNFSVAQTEELCDSCVLFGEISKIFWQGTEASYDMAPAGEIRVAAGHTSAEALSAELVRSMSLSEDTERLLTAIQYDLADSADVLDGNYKLDDEIFLREFQRLEGDVTGSELRFSMNRQTEDKEPELGKLFSDYSRANRKLFALERKLEKRRARLFCAWEQYMLCYEDPRFVPGDAPERSEMLQEILRIATEEIKGLEEQISGQKELCRQYKEKLRKELGEVLETADEPFYAPKDPVLLFSGSGMKRAYAFGEDGRFTNDGTLFCQTGVLKANIGLEALIECLSEAPFFDRLPKEYGDLLYQGLLLSDDCLPVIEKNVGKVEFAGNLPSEAAKNIYHKEPITLFLAWEAEYLPTETNPTPEGALKGWEYSADETNYRYTGGMWPAQLKKEYISGRTVLTPHAVIHFSESIKRWLEVHPDATGIAEAAEKIKNLAVVSQNLDGFTRAMLGLRHTFQFPIAGVGGDKAVAQVVSEQISSERLSVLPEGTLRHMRGGMFGIHRLSLVGTFGQTQSLSDSSYFGDRQITFSESMERVEPNYALLPPAFFEPVRLRAHFISAGDDGVLSSSAPETSPVYGIILPELLNKRLMIYNANGEYLGSVNTAYEGEKTVARWVDGIFPERTFARTDIGDKRLRAFVQALLEIDGALSDILGLIDIYYQKKLIPHSQKQIWGRPFVLARCSIQFEFLGEPEYDKSISSFGRYDTKGAEKIRFPVMIGDMERATDGVLGCFDDDYGYGGLCPAFGTDIKHSGRYLLPQNQIKICAETGEKLFSVMMAGHAGVTLQTGLMPGQRLSLPAGHAAAADELLAAAEMNPVIVSTDQAALPLEGYTWKYRDGGKFVQHKILPPFTGFDETMIMDGFIGKEREDE